MPSSCADNTSPFCQTCAASNPSLASCDCTFNEWVTLETGSVYAPTSLTPNGPIAGAGAILTGVDSVAYSGGSIESHKFTKDDQLHRDVYEAGKLATAVAVRASVAATTANEKLAAYVAFLTSRGLKQGDDFVINVDHIEMR